MWGACRTAEGCWEAPTSRWQMEAAAQLPISRTFHLNFENVTNHPGETPARVITAALEDSREIGCALADRGHCIPPRR